MISAVEAKSRIDGNNDEFEREAAVIADYLVEVLAADAVEQMVSHRSERVSATYDLDAGYRPAFEALGKGHLKSMRENDEWNILTQRARQIANSKLSDLGYTGGFFDEMRGEPRYAGGSGCYYVLVLRLSICDEASA